MLSLRYETSYPPDTKDDQHEEMKTVRGDAQIPSRIYHMVAMRANRSEWKRPRVPGGIFFVTDKAGVKAELVLLQLWRRPHASPARAFEPGHKL